MARTKFRVLWPLLLSAVLLYLLAYAATCAVSPLAAAHLGVPVDLRDNDPAASALATPTPSAALAYTQAVRALATLTIVNAPLPAPTPRSLEDTENILVLGIDSRPNGDSWRLGSIMVIVFDRKAGQAGILSIPGDLYVSIPGHGQQRIDAAEYLGETTHYPGGGPALVRRIVQEEVGIPTQHYVRIKQNGLARLVDALGGVEVTLPCPLYEAATDPGALSGPEQLALPAGKVYLDGQTAEKFVTYHQVTADPGREEREQQVFWAIHERAAQGDILPHVPELWRTLSGSFSTDVGALEAVQLAGLWMRLRGSDIHGATLTPGLVRPFITSAGEEVLLLNDAEMVKARLASLFASPPLGVVDKTPRAEACPKPPPGFPDLSPLW
jgi:LCP family protein required for cell wall assembly